MRASVERALRELLPDVTVSGEEPRPIRNKTIRWIIERTYRNCTLSGDMVVDPDAPAGSFLDPSRGDSQRWMQVTVRVPDKPSDVPLVVLEAERTLREAFA
jgi:hypothetical protein